MASQSQQVLTLDKMEQDVMWMEVKVEAGLFTWLHVIAARKPVLTANCGQP